jgi:hypothetical protein
VVGRNKSGNSLEGVWVAFVHQGLTVSVNDRIHDVGEEKGGWV